MNANAQQGYWVEDEFIALNPDESCTFKYVQAMDEESQKTISDLYDSLSETENCPLRKIDNDRFLVANDYDLTAGDFYESLIYMNQEGGRVTVLPRIVVSLMEDSQIDGILDYLDGKVFVESSERNRYVLACQMRKSSEVLDAVLAIHDYVTEFGGIKYFEPEMYLPVSVSWTTGVGSPDCTASQAISHYSLDGCRMVPSAKGIHIVRMGDRTVRKVIVK